MHLYLGYGNFKYLVLNWQLILNDNLWLIAGGRWGRSGKFWVDNEPLYLCSESSYAHQAKSEQCVVSLYFPGMFDGVLDGDRQEAIQGAAVDGLAHANSPCDHLKTVGS